MLVSNKRITVNKQKHNKKEMTIYEKAQDKIKILSNTGESFFEKYGTQKLMGQDLWEIIGSVDPAQRFSFLLSVWGFPGNPMLFFNSLISLLGSDTPPVMNGVRIPVLFILKVLEILLPENSLVAVKTVEDLNKLEKKIGLKFSNKASLRNVLELYPVRLSDHILKLSLISRKVAEQFLPFVDEIDSIGSKTTFEGHFKTGIIERIYQNRVIFLLGMDCPVYCRFCFRKHKNTRVEKDPGLEDVKEALRLVADFPQLNEILITGGEPLLYLKKLTIALNGLIEISHIKTVRIATRSISYFPRLFFNKGKKLIKILKSWQIKYKKQEKRIEIGIHFLHPDEISIQSLEIIRELIGAGIRVYLQTPFLAKVNNDSHSLSLLFQQLRNVGVKIYYIFTPCHPIKGTRKYWTSISESIRIYNYLRKNLSDRCMPKLCTATSLGKIEWQTSGWAVEQDEENSDNIWIRTPYFLDYFKDSDGKYPSLPSVREDKNGFLEVKMQADIGDKRLFLKSNEQRRENLWKDIGQESGQNIFKVSNRTLCQKLNAEKKHFIFKFDFDNIVARNQHNYVDKKRKIPVYKAHKTRLDFDISCAESALRYLESDSSIIDVVIYGAGKENFEVLKTFLYDLKQIINLVWVRVCWNNFTSSPENLDANLINRLAKLTIDDIANPFHIEFEVWFTHPSEITAQHGQIAQNISDAGMNIYANVPLIFERNDNSLTMVELSHTLRNYDIEFHHLYTSGLPLQKLLNQNDSISTQTVIDIASTMRTSCSGREIPLYVIKTPLGEMDFGLTNCLSESYI